jgi:hypothetical protein
MTTNCKTCGMSMSGTACPRCAFLHERVCLWCAHYLATYECGTNWCPQLVQQVDPTGPGCVLYISKTTPCIFADSREELYEKITKSGPRHKSISEMIRDVYHEEEEDLRDV